MRDSHYIIKTERLGLRTWKMDDVDQMSVVNADPRVMEHFPSTQDRSQTAGFVERSIKHQETHGYCYFATEVLSTKELIGFVGLAYQTYETSFTPATDIGWRLKPSAWGKGYATEGARACLDFAWKELQLNHVISVAVEANANSINVMKKIGMQYQHSFDHPLLGDYPDLQKCVYYKIERP